MCNREIPTLMFPPDTLARMWFGNEDHTQGVGIGVGYGPDQGLFGAVNMYWQDDDGQQFQMACMLTDDQVLELQAELNRALPPIVPPYPMDEEGDPPGWVLLQESYGLAGYKNYQRREPHRLGLKKDVAWSVARREAEPFVRAALAHQRDQIIQLIDRKAGEWDQEGRVATANAIRAAGLAVKLKEEGT